MDTMDYIGQVWTLTNSRRSHLKVSIYADLKGSLKQLLDYKKRVGVKPTLFLL